MMTGISSATPTRAITGDILSQVDAAIWGLQRRCTSSKKVHETRNDFTQLRAALRLLRLCMGGRIYHRCNNAVRDARRRFDAARDAKVLIDTVGRLRRAADSVDVKRVIDRLVKMFTQELTALPPCRRASRESITALQAVFHHVEKMPQSRHQVMSFAVGVSHAYKKCRTSLQRAEDRPTDANLHEWRKQIKYLFFESSALSRFSRPQLSQLRHRTRRLAAYLGDDHDLAVLQARISDIQRLAPFQKSRGSIDELVKRMRRSRAGLQRKAFRLGKKSFHERPKSFRLELNLRCRRTI